MRYKNIELGQNEEDELLLCVKLNKPNKTLSQYKKMREKWNQLLKTIEQSFFIEFVLDDVAEIRCYDKQNGCRGIPLTQQGIDLLKSMYDCMHGNIEGEVSVGIMVGGYDMFKRKDGTEYNQDVVSWDDFIKNLEMDS